MKIGIFSDTFPPQVNGVANTALTSAIVLSNLGHDVYVYTVSGSLFNREEKAEDEKEFPFTLVRLPSIPAVVYHDQRIPLPLGLAVKHARKVGLDIIHTHTPFSVGWEAILTARFFKIPIVGTHHTFYDKYLKHVKLDYDFAKSLSWDYINFYYNRCDIVLSPSKSLAIELKNFGLVSPVEIMINPIDTELFKPVKNNRIKQQLKQTLGVKDRSLVYMGRVSYEKKIDQIIKAFALVIKQKSELGLVIVGDGPERNKLEALSKSLGLKNHILFTGFKRGEELVEILQANDIFITASDSENMPLSVLEAMAVGLPVIGANALGIPEIVEDNVNGFLFEPDNTKDLAQKIITLIGNNQLLDSFSQNSRKLALNYSQENVTRSLETVYERIIK